MDTAASASAVRHLHELPIVPWHAVRLLALAAMLVTGCGESEDQRQTVPPNEAKRPAPTTIWGHTFRAIRITEGEPLVADTTLRVHFDRNRRRIGWSAGCNAFGARVNPRHQVLRVDRIIGTLMACDAELEKQEERLTEFFRSNPSWELEGPYLTLTSDQARIEFEPARDRADDGGEARTTE